MSARQLFFWFLTIPALFVMQIFSSSVLTVHGIYPDLLLLGTLYFALESGAMTGVWIGWILGLCADSSSAGPFGAQMFTLTLVGYIVGRFQSQLDETKPVAQISLTFFTSAFSGVIFSILITVFADMNQHVKIAMQFGQSVYTAFAAPVIFALLRFWGQRFGREQPDRTLSL